MVSAIQKLVKSISLFKSWYVLSRVKFEFTLEKHTNFLQKVVLRTSIKLTLVIVKARVMGSRVTRINQIFQFEP